MIATKSLVTAPVRLPVSIGEAKAAAKIESEDEDALVDAWITEAAAFVAEYCGRQLITSTFDAYFDRFPGCADRWGEYSLELPLGPVQSVTSVTYLDGNGATQTWPATEYRLDRQKSPARVVRGYDKSFPTYRLQSGSVVVRFVAGYGDNPGDVPEPIRNWIREQVAYRHMVRARTLAGAQGAIELPAWMGVDALDFYRTSWL